ncbi:MAG TPA: acyltransferase [Desulfotomaculum sp.]|nr:MAG: hypothetical protein VR67_07045 [Peptococcaceae bacterium BRH_c8a]KJS73586.1 MAG: hypothetical protein JL56_10880 [Desulfotomaculum sp. BICA1-6]HBX23109.1 acyltransferase [Desulfotomaculum sp.]
MCTGESTTTKMLFLNNIKVFLTVLVVTHHTAITYGALGSWFYYEPTEDMFVKVLLTLFAAINQSFFMGFFFLIAGYFTPASFNRKGAGRYMKDRLVRLGIPLLFFSVFIGPLLSYQYYVNFTSLEFSFGEFLYESFVRFKYINTGPMWFVQTLLIFTTVYALWRLARKSGPHIPDTGLKNKLPSSAAIVIYIVALAVVSFIVRIWYPIGTEFVNLQLGYFPGYISLFAIGIMAYQRNWFAKLPDTTGELWMKTAVYAIFAWPVIVIVGGALNSETSFFAGGLHWQSMAICIWESTMGTGIILGLLTLFRGNYNRQNNLLEHMSSNAYTVYIIHAPVIVLLSYLLKDIPIYPLLKLVLVATVGVPLCFIISHCMVRRIPGAGRIL